MANSDKNKKDDEGVLLCWLYPSCGSPIGFVTLLFISLVVASTPVGYLGGVTTNIERRFQLKSSEIGFLSVLYDICALATGFFVAHYGSKRHRGRVVGTLFVLGSLGALLNAVPHILYPVPKAVQDSSLVISVDNETYGLCGSIPDCEDGVATLKSQTIWIAFGQVMASLATSIVPLSMPYIDDSVTKQSAPIYVAVIFSAYSVGGVLGFFLATACISIPAYPFHIGELGYPSADISDPNYLGAWWLGYVVISLNLLALSPFYFMFPRTLRKTSGRRLEDAENVSNNVNDEKKKTMEDEIDHGSLLENIVAYLKSLFTAMRRLLRNTTIVLLSFLGAAKLATFGGQLLFGSKYLEKQFLLDPAISSTLFGSLIVPSGLVGNFVGGYIVKRFGKTNLDIGYIMLIFTVLAFLVDPVILFLGCNSEEIVGVNVPYPMFTNPTNEIMLANECNADCNCAADLEPVCGSNNLTYLSPCHAGCVNQYINYENITMYSNCDCVSSDQNLAFAVKGSCPSEPCLSWIPYFVLGLFSSAIVTLFTIPGFMLGLRCVDEQDRSLALTLGNFIGKIFGDIPGRPIYGAFLEIPCLQQLTSQCNDDTGNCLVYDNKGMRFAYNGLTLFIHVIVTILTILVVWTLWKKRNDEEDQQLVSSSSTMKKDDMDMGSRGVDNKALEAVE